MDNIVLVKQYRVENEFNKSQHWYQNKVYAKRSKYPSNKNETVRSRKGGWAEIKIDVEAATR